MERLLPGQSPVLTPGHTLETITDKIASIVLRRPVTLGWVGGFAFFFGLMNLLLFAMAYLFYRGVGIWGINIPVGWGFAIVNFVWWVGIGHAGTLISAILLLLKQGWRRRVSADPHWPSMVGVLVVPVSQHDGCVAAVPQPSALGRVCGFDLRYDLRAVLVRGTDSGSCDVPRHGYESCGKDDLWIAGDGLAWFGAALETL
jgi:hypothetical protein